MIHSDTERFYMQDTVHGMAHGPVLCLDFERDLIGRPIQGKFLSGGFEGLDLGLFAL